MRKASSLYRITVEVLLFAACVLSFSASGGCLLFGAPKVIVSCKAVNIPEEIVHHYADNHAVLEEVDDWLVVCAITRGADTVWAGELTLEHPTTYETAMAAINKFRKEEAPKILKQKKEK